jgi:hypothetical protein
MTRPLTTVSAAISARLDLLKRALISPQLESGPSREDQAASKTACAVHASDCRQCFGHPRTRREPPAWVDLMPQTLAIDRGFGRSLRMICSPAGFAALQADDR